MNASTDTPGPETVLIRIRAAMPALRPSEQRIAQALLENPSECAAYSIVRLAARCGTSTTSVVRFYQRLGYSHYKDLRLDVAMAATRDQLATSNLPDVSGDVDRGDTLQDIVSKLANNETLSIADTANTLDIAALERAVQLVVAARRIDSFGVGASSFIGLDLQQKLSRIGHTAIDWAEPHAAWTAAATLDSSCVAIAISHSGATTDTIEFLAVAKEAGAATIAVTNFPESPLGSNADIVLATAARESRFRSGALGSRIAQLMVIDCLFTGVAQANYDQSIEAIRKTYQVVHRRRSKAWREPQPAEGED